MADPSISKPRRLEDTTATYLAEIETRYAELCKREKIEGNLEDKAVLVRNALSEIHSRAASAACDRRTNYIVEQLCFEADMPLLLSLMESWAAYTVFLARNRYASHVVQVHLFDGHIHFRCHGGTDLLPFIFD
jgi:hypothetical protein